MTGDEIIKLAKMYPDYDFGFVFTDESSKFLNVRVFENLELADVGYSDKVVLLTGEER